MEKKICIGDVRAICEAYYSRTKQRLPFFKALGLAFEGAPVLRDDVWSSGFMSLEEFVKFIDSFPLPNPTQIPTEKQNNHMKITLTSQDNDNWFGSAYITEQTFFEDLKDIRAHIHIPFVNDGMHTHDHFEINYIYNGEALLSFGEERSVLKAGSVCIFPPDYPHNINALQDALVIAIVVRKTTFEIVFSSLLKQSGDLSAFLLRSLHENSVPNYLIYQTDNSIQIKAYLQEIMREQKKNDSYCSMNIASIITLLFSLILRQHGQTAVFFDINDQFVGSYNFLLLLQYIKQNYRTITLPKLAFEFHYSETYLSKKIHDTTGSSFSQLIQNLRMENGKNLLRATEWSLRKICDAIGYESTDHFTRVFKKRYGMAPSQYRQEHNRSS